MKTTVFVGTSVDGFIARASGALDFLPPGGGEPHGYEEFMATVDALVIGRKTYETVLNFDRWPYGEKRVVVLSAHPLAPAPPEAVVEHMSGTPAEIVSRLASRGIGHIYVDGGNTIQRFLRAGLIHRLIITRVPVLIGAGVPLFGELPGDIALKHVATRQYVSGLVQSEYVVPPDTRFTRPRDNRPPPVMPSQQTLRTERLLLRPFRLEDASVVQQLAGAREVADTTVTIPHPYLDGMAEAWIGTHANAWERQERVTFAMTSEADGVVGAIALRLTLAHRRAELGYWVGRPFWNRGYATEAARAVLTFGFEALELNRIHASHLARNPASGRVMAKAGLRFEGTFREHVVRWGRAEDLCEYAILRADLPVPGSSPG